MKAVVFPGQGAQYAGMGKDLFDYLPPARDIFAKIDGIVGWELSKKCFCGRGEDLKDTYIQQLAILTVSLAAFEIFRRKNIKIDYLSGLSLGEYTCLYAAEVLNLEDVVRLVKVRASAMQEAAKLNPSAMAVVIGIEEERLRELSKREGFYLANFNSPQQTAVSLKSEDKQRLRQVLEDEGARVIDLDVSGGFHSPFMAPARQRLGKAIESLQFKEANRPIVSNVSGRPHIDKDEIKRNLLEQLTSPVLWKDCVESMVAGGVKTFFEVGPSRVLRGLIRKIAPETRVVNVEKREDLDSLEIEGN